jgi:hypothetical protein
VAKLDDAIAELDRLLRRINTPKTDDFFESVRVESDLVPSLKKAV